MQNHARNRSASKQLFAGAVGLSALSFAWAATAQAQTAPSDTNPVAPRAADQSSGDIIVTAQRREQSVQDVGIAINVVGGDLVNQMNIRRGSDLALIVPGVSAVTQQVGSSGSFAIRGVTQNSTAIHQEGPVALYTDDVYISNAQMQSPQLFDIQRVEVLKGPQGTLFGRNATGGLVHIVSNRPTQDFEGYVDLTYGSHNERRVEAAVSGPLASGVSARVAILSDNFDPIFKNPISNNYGDLDSFAGRAHLLFEPSSNLNVLVTGYYSLEKTASGGMYQSVPAIAVYSSAGLQTDSRVLGPNETARTIVAGVATGTRPCAGCNFFGYRDPDGPGEISAYGPIGAASGSPSVFKSASYNHVKLEQYAETANVSWHSGQFSLVSITDARHYNTVSVTPLQFSGLVNGISPVQYYQAGNIGQFSQEIRGSVDTGRFRGTAGGYYLSIDGFWETGNGPMADGTDIYEFHKIKTASTSGFVNAEFDVAPTVTLIGGARFIHEIQRLDTQGDVRSAPNTIVQIFGRFNPSISPLARNKFDLWAWRAAINWKPSSETLVYASVNRGVKAGGFNIPTPNSFTTYPFNGYPYRPEDLMAYEVGIKQEFMGGRMRAELSGFYYDYNNYQAAISINLVRSIYNLQARIYGLDFQVSGKPINNLYVSLGGSYLDALVKNVQINDALIADRRMTYTPDLKLTGVVRYTIPVGRNKLNLQGDVQYSSSYETSLFGYSALHQPKFATLNANVEYEFNNFSVSAFVRNITDQRYIVSANDLASSRGEEFIAYSFPRWFGVSAKYQW